MLCSSYPVAAGIKTVKHRIRRFANLLLPSLVWLCLVPLADVPMADGHELWRIGQSDGSTTGFALAPGGYEDFSDDALFLVGESDPQRDWPYVQPGPVDAWAGSRPHTFTVLFGLASVPEQGTCRLQIELFDTQRGRPPTLNVEVNGTRFRRRMPGGKGDQTIRGEDAEGNPRAVSIEFPAGLLRTGDNQISLTTVSGSWLLYDAIGLTVHDGASLAPCRTRTAIERVRPLRALVQHGDRLRQPVQVTVRHVGEPVELSLRLGAGPPVEARVSRQSTTLELFADAVEEPTMLALTGSVAERPLARRAIAIEPVRHLTVYLLPHSHIDIGYTDHQTAIERKQVQNLEAAIEAARRTADYPPGARFVWNAEVFWSVQLFLERRDESSREALLDAIRRGQIVLNGMYLNQLTGLCREEELLRLFAASRSLAKRAGVEIDAAMISDVPGYTWGVVTAMQQAGIKYFSVAPNYFDRIGTILREWENKPFYWVGPDGQSQVLVWIPYRGYALSHGLKTLSPQFVNDYQERLDQTDYPYEIAYLRWSGIEGDNAAPDPTICDFVKDWNARYAWPRFIISGTSEAFFALEQRHGDQLPRARGDWTPYWEDGAGSSARQTGMNRASTDRLTQAAALFAIRRPQSYPASDFNRAWHYAMLYSEHTWGAHCSIWGPERDETRQQWATKRSYAEQADQRSRTLLDAALAPKSNRANRDNTPHGDNKADGDNVIDSDNAIDVYNSVSWSRSELVTVSAKRSAAGDRVLSDRGQPVPSQRLRSGELAFLARDVPPLAARRFTIVPGPPHVESPARVLENTLDSGVIRVTVDPETGGIGALTLAGLDENYVDTRDGQSINDYLYFNGDDPSQAVRNGPVTISVVEPGPLVASLQIESAAPGCHRLIRTLRVVAGSAVVELHNLVDKQRLVATSYSEPAGKESVNFAFPLHVPDGQMWLGLPLAAMRPELDQIPSACKNWFTVGRWVDVSNADRGITWVTLDAPLIQIGGLTANLLQSQSNPDVWRRQVEPTQTFYSWVMNNHWGTNYRAYQEGPTRFRYALRPHRGSTKGEATRLAIGFSQPLRPVAAHGRAPSNIPLVQIDPPGLLAIAVKPSDDGKATIVRLLSASEQTEHAQLTWRRPLQGLWISDTSERAGEPVRGDVEVPAGGVVTLRAQFQMRDQD